LHTWLAVPTGVAAHTASHILFCKKDKLNIMPVFHSALCKAFRQLSGVSSGSAAAPHNKEILSHIFLRNIFVHYSTEHLKSKAGFLLNFYFIISFPQAIIPFSAVGR